MKPHFNPEQWNTFTKRIRESDMEEEKKKLITFFLANVFQKDSERFNADRFITAAIPEFVAAIEGHIDEKYIRASLGMKKRK